MNMNFEQSNSFGPSSFIQQQQPYVDANTMIINAANIPSTQILTSTTTFQPYNSFLGQTDYMSHSEQQNTIFNQTFPSEQISASEHMYTKYENLPNFGPSLDIVSIVNLLQLYFEDKTNWKKPFDAIDNLRILNKYYPNELNNIVSLFWKYIVECIEHPKTFICKNTLVFITEIFMNSRNVRLHDDIITGLVPQVLSKASSEKGFMKKEAENALKELTVNCCYDSTVVILCQQVLDKNPAIGDIASLTLAQILNNIGENISKLNSSTLIILTKTMAKTLDTGKHANMKKYATLICSYIFRLFGLENYISLVKNSSLSQGEEIAMSKVIESKKDRRNSGFQEFVQEKKKLARMSQMASGTSFGTSQEMKENFSLHSNQGVWSAQNSILSSNTSSVAFQGDNPMSNNNFGSQQMFGTQATNTNNSSMNFINGGNGALFQRLF